MNLVLVPPNYGLYEKCSAAFMGILWEYSDIVEQYSIDEAFVDMTASCHLFGEPVEVAEQINVHLIYYKEENRWFLLKKF
ncbi:MAG: hypothetical protein J1E98_08515 [Lachnospiraceae bacterium]|nr:hypothetical protein [Lachnospiraceae bacterium]